MADLYLVRGERRERREKKEAGREGEEGKEGRYISIQMTGRCMAGTEHLYSIIGVVLLFPL